MDMVLGLWPIDQLMSDDEPGSQAVAAMVEVACRYAEKHGYPLRGAKSRVMRLDAHRDSYGGICLFPGWSLGKDARPTLEAYAAQMVRSRGDGWNPYVVCFVLDVDSSG